MMLSNASSIKAKESLSHRRICAVHMLERTYKEVAYQDDA